MGLLRGIGRAAPLVAAGLAAGWYLRRQGLLGGPPQPELVAPPPAPAPPPASEEPLEAHVEAVAAVSDAADVPSVVEDLLAAEPEVMDAEVVDEERAGDLDERVLEALGDIPAQVESYRGVVWLRGELDRRDAIEEAEHRAASVSGVSEVRNLLHLPGSPPPRDG